jgi:hypothetical protein
MSSPVDSEPFHGAREPRFESAYAPLSPSSPLPPALSEAVVVRAYRSWGFKPKRVLYAMRTKPSVESPASCLRRHVDDPGFRQRREDRRAEKAVPAFYNALYKYLKGTPNGRTVHSRLVAPAEFEAQDIIFLDPVRFRDRLAGEKSELRNQSASIEPSSEEEALALFALAFALRP